MEGWLLNLTRVGAVGSGLMAGLFFVFSVAIMPALDRLGHPGGMRAMQAINADIQNPLFLLVFLGSGVAGAALAVSAAWTWDQPGAGYRLAGGLLIALGSLVLTVVYHVPRNDALDAVDAASSGAADEWARYVREWVPWNHVRAAASTASSIALLLALSA
jgi:uncharacterized membrane protein